MVEVEGGVGGRRVGGGDRSGEGIKGVGPGGGVRVETRIYRRVEEKVRDKNFSLKEMTCPLDCLSP